MAVLAIVLIGGDPVTRAVVGMGCGLLVLWVGLGGALSRRYRDAVRRRFELLPGPWQVRFVAFCTLLALVEEAITTTMTNLAPLFGVPVGKAYITASANYIDVVCLHSVVVFVPMFVGWAWILTRVDFAPNMVFLLFGAAGVLAEVTFGGPQQFAQFGFWIMVYGLMVYLPAYCIPANRGAKAPRWWHYPLAVIGPGILSGPVAGVVSWLHPVKIHFPPLTPGS